MRLWLKAIGTAEQPLRDNWVKARGVLAHLGFPKHGRPSVAKGDRCAIYGAGTRRVIGIVDVTSDPFRDEKLHGPRWPWAVKVQPLLLVPRVSAAPTLEEVGIEARRLMSKSHIKLEPSEYRRIVAGLADAASLNGEVYWPIYPDFD